METPIIEKKLEILLTAGQCKVLMAGISSGMINLESLQKSLSIVFGDRSGESNTTGILKDLSIIGGIIKTELDKHLAVVNPELPLTNLKTV